MASTAPDILELRERVEALHAAVSENRLALDALRTQSGNRREPRLRNVIDALQSDLKAQRQAIDWLIAESEKQREELARLKDAAGPPKA